ncbi:hypothetical protein I317_05210 [Kwoniella heveanensis CBS 569]|nr:hypothetical protein I317_05210 [Kwoniella heveanensis CBS 569]
MTYSMKTFLLESIWPQGRAAPRDVQLFTQKPEERHRYGDDDNQGSFTKDGGIGGDACQVFVTPSTAVRPWDSAILPAGVKEFLDERRFYKEEGLPYKRGYMYQGVPESWKSSLIAALAAKPRLDIYIVHPSFEGIDDATLQSLLQAYPPKGIVLLEDM